MYGDTVELLVGELLTNAFEHGRGNVALRLCRGDRQVRIDVVDDLRKLRLTALPGEELTESGRGLALVEALAESWGVTPDGFGVWCAVAVTGPQGIHHDAPHLREPNHDR
ncbi:ATP-binding protein [Streptomyces qinzhouensis]|uniref:ATP-binding protein n=1 Tax=Streptomyces qinzhouensis TaxID=2599401 RepID=UPI0016481660|nr:ATP-binding protein [Streptomyces qinzhouensis]